MDHPDELDQLPPSVAIVGFAVRFPGARNVEEFWDNLCGGVESITFFSDDELEDSKLDPYAPGDPAFVTARGIIEEADYFDAAFFGYSHREAEIIDPQQRVFLECAWEALENAGYDPESCEERIGVYAGASVNRYLLNNLFLNPEVVGQFGALQTLIANDKDFLPTRVSYKLDLKGPSINVQTACSTSLVAVHLACQGLLNGECDLALGGGSSIRVPQRVGYLYQPGGMSSPDGHCRAFDARAQGTVFSDGVGIVVLKRLEDAIADGDRIRAVIRGSAVNNDGAAKIGFTAPSVDSQAEVIAEALAVARVCADTVTYVEAHGTGTELGDPIELTALTRAFRTSTDRRGYCGIGSVKTNVGHLDAAAGVAGLIKTALALEHGLIPPSLHFETPNPKLDLDTSPFYVNAALAEWRPQGMPRRAGVTSLGVGGTNVHAILEQAPPCGPSGASRPWQLLVLSARSAEALERATADLAAHLRRHRELALADVAFTLQRGRRAFVDRRAVVCRDREEAVAVLAGSDPGRMLTAAGDAEARTVVFMFPGQGVQHVGMGAELYRGEPTFRGELDRCATLLKPHLGLDLRRVLYPATGAEEEAARQLATTRLTQPALFAVEYALAQLWMEWGIRPAAMIGHSIGEIVAACVAGVLTLEDALSLVAVRGRLMQELPAGAMLSVPLAEAELVPLLGRELALAAVNAPARCVASGPEAAVTALEKRLAGRELSCRRLHTSHAFHSPMMDPVLEPLTRWVEQLRLHPPKIPYLSNRTGTRITADEATDPGYWARHLRGTVRFAAGLRELLEDSSCLLLEVGPGTALGTLARQHPERKAEQAVVSSLAPPRAAGSDVRSLLLALGHLWLAGAAVDWQGFHAHQPRRRVPLPTYPFERRRYWVDPAPAVELPAAPRQVPARVEEPPEPRSPQHPRPALRTPFEPPRDELERTLAEIWQELLGVDQVGIHDNFFELGGDSIIGLQIVIRAGRAGLRMTPRQLLDLQSIAELAPVIEPVDAAAGEPRPLTGAVELTPIQHWFFEHRLAAPHHFNHTLFFELPEALNPSLLEEAFRRLIDHHDALRLRFYRQGSQWRQEIAAPERVSPFALVDLSAVAEDRRSDLLESVGAAVQASLDLDRGPLVRLVVCELGAERSGRLLLSAHHLAVDYLSWPILLEDLWAGYRALSAGRPVALGAKTTSFPHWVERLRKSATPALLARESDYWLDEDRHHAARLPVDFPEGREANTMGSLRTVTVSLDEQATLALLRQVPARYRTRTEEVLLAALVPVLNEWTGGRFLLVDAEGSGREIPLEGVDLSRTVGWFTTLYPLLLEATETREPQQALARIKEQCRRVPGDGFGYGLLRYLAGDPTISERLAALPPAEILFSYLGQAAPAVRKGSSSPAPAPEPHGPARDPRGHRRHLLEITATLIRGRLKIDWAYSENVHRRETIQALAEAFLRSLRALIDHCLSLDACRYTPSDFPEAGMDQDELDAFFARFGDLAERDDVEDVYPLSATQEGILFHTLYDAESHVYREQIHFRLRGELDLRAFRKAWSKVAERHPVLRTLVVWEHQGKALQVVRCKIALPWRQEDWRELAAGERERRLHALRSEELEAGFDLSRAPLMRLTVVRTGERTHRFLWTYHHLLLDGWSMSLVLGEVSACYAKYCHGEEPILPPAPPYRRYVTWLRQREASADEAFWRGYLEGFATPTRIAVDRRAGSDSALEVEERPLRLTPETTAALESMARRHQLTVNTIFRGAWALLLSRHSGQRDVVFGATVAGRPADLPGVEAIAGLFINTLPVRARISPDKSLLPWLKEIQARQSEAHQYESTPLVRIREWSEVPAGVPLFESLLVFENYPLTTHFGTRTLEVEDLGFFAHTHYPLMVMISPGRELVLRIVGDRQRFASTGIARLLRHLQNLLAGILADPHRPLRSPSMLSPAERHQCLVEWSDAGRPYAIDEETFPARFRHRARQCPEAVALALPGARWTYGELHRRANQLAHHLRALGVGPETRVGILMERSPESVASLLAILGAGGAYLPLDPDSPPERMAFMLADAGIGVVVADEASAGRLGEFAGEVVLPARQQAEIRGRPAAPPAVSAGSDRLAYVLYTSGSTGRPKGVMVSHRQLAVYLAWCAHAYPVSGQVPVHSPLSFDFTVTGLLAPLAAGGTVHLLPPGAELDALVASLRGGDPFALVKLTPAHLEALNRLRVPQQLAAPVDALILGGEALSWQSLGPWRRHAPASRLINEYGPTEAVVGCAVCEIPPGAADDGPTVPIGRPIPGARLYVLAGDLRPLPAGAAGELCIGGAAVARGYLGRPGLTAERFAPDPFAVPGARMFRTGDLVRLRADGNAEFLGRLDHQVKLRGFRIEPGEIEATLEKHPEVEQAVVIVRERDPGDKRLIAFLAGARPDAEELRRWLAPMLPDYMIPSAFVCLDRLPLTPNGKIDRTALTVPEDLDRPAAESWVAPRTAIEETVAQIWSEVLKLERVGVHDHFTQLGGHSLLATQIISRIRESFEIELPIRTLFEAPTVAGMARAVADQRGTAQSISAPPLVAVPREGPLPLSFAQQRLWILNQWAPENPFYNVPTALRLEGRIEPDTLRSCLEEIAGRHETLRTTFALVDGEPVQVIHDRPSSDFIVEDLRHLPESERRDRCRHLLNVEAWRPFDLERGPLLRVRLYRTGDDSHVLVLVLHHIVSDGWSSGLLVGETTELYRAALSGREPELPELPIQYGDFTLWQRRWIAGEILEQQIAYWKRQLAGAPPRLELPTDRAAPAEPTFRGARERLALPAELSERIRALSREHEVTLFVTLFAAFTTLLYRYTGQEDLVLGSPVANRNRSEIEGLIGFFVNTLVLRTDHSGNPSFLELLRRVRDVTLGAYAHQDLPFERLVKEIQPARDLSHTPLFNLMFILQNAPAGELQVPGLNIHPLEIDLARTHFDLTFQFWEEGGALIGTTFYRTELFEAASIRRLLFYYQRLLEGIVADPETRIAQLPFDRAEERETSTPEAAAIRSRRLSRNIKERLRQLAQP